MTPARSRSFLGLLGLVLFGLACASLAHPSPRAAPAALDAEIDRIGRTFPGAVGVSVEALDGGWRADWNGARLFPQQSVSKLWVSIALLDALDGGRLALSDKVRIGREDLTLFHQPIREEVLAKGGADFAIADLFDRAITQSDNSANDSLLRRLGGPGVVRAMLAKKRLGAIRFADGERALQSRIAGLEWKQDYAFRNAFFDARNALPMATRKAAFEAYVADPDDGASASALTAALARLVRGDLLSPSSTRLLLDTMARTETGKLRVRAALAPGWTWNHKTGTGQELDGRQAGLNDVGILTAPDGKRYALAILANPGRLDGSAQAMMQEVARAVMKAHDGARR